MKTIAKLIPLASIAALALPSCREGAEGTTVNVDGSDTMLEVGLAWSEAYKKIKPDVTVSVNGEGSGIGITALINGTVNMAHSSRAMSDKEKDAVKKAHGKDAVEHIVGYDGIAVYVHPDNPVKSLSMPQLKAIWGRDGGIDNWKDVGGPDLNITRAGRSNTSGTYKYFQKFIVQGEYHKDTSGMPGSTAVVHFCETTPSGIGYSGMSYKTDKVAWLAISKEDGGQAHMPSVESVGSGDYPVARPLYIYTVGEPEGAEKEYLDWIKSAEGQKILSENKFVPLAPK